MTAFRHLTLRERIYEEIVRMIVSGELPSGAQIDERALTQRLDVSRTPFREAIGTLAKEGLVEIRPYRGYYVRSFSPKEIADLYDLRITLECFAVRLAVENIDRAGIAELERLLDECVAALRRGDMQTYSLRDREFHRTIARTSGNVALIETLERLDMQVQICRLVANECPSFPERAAMKRDEILEAFRKRDVKRAEDLMRAHITEVRSAVVEQMPQEREAPV